MDGFVYLSNQDNIFKWGAKISLVFVFQVASLKQKVFYP